MAKDSSGSGPRLRFGSDNDELNTRVERDFTAWSEMIRLATKPKTIRIARVQDGEEFVILANNPALRGPVHLDLQLEDADRFCGDSAALDMLNAAQVQSLNLQNKTTTLATEYARQGKNWKTELEQIKKEQAFAAALDAAKSRCHLTDDQTAAPSRLHGGGDSRRLRVQHLPVACARSPHLRRLADGNDRASFGRSSEDTVIWAPFSCEDVIYLSP